MTQKIAVAIIHGVGQQKIGFSTRMEEKLKDRFLKSFKGNEKESITEELVFEEVFWADVLGKNEDDLWGELKFAGDLDFTGLRKFILNFAADAIAYQPGQEREQVYDAIHKRLGDALKELAKDTKAGPEAPLCVIGHSLGTIISHNFFYDIKDKQAGSRFITQANLSSLESGDTFTLFVTMGSPLALWSLRYAAIGDYKPIDFPGEKVKILYPKVKPKWLNYYDADDVFAYPIRRLSDGHKLLARKRILEDHLVDAGSLLTSWSPLSHNGYWTDKDIINPIGDKLAKIWKTINKS